MNKQCCIDYFKFRFDNYFDMPDTKQEYMDDCKMGKEPGSADFTFINESCKILLLKPCLLETFRNDRVNTSYYLFFCKFLSKIVKTVKNGKVQN